MKNEKRKLLMDRVGHKLPIEQRTEFNMDRWLDSYEGDIDRCETMINEYLKNRKALGLDQPEALEDFYSRPDVKHFCHIFPQSKLQKGWINSYDNGVVFVEAGISDPSKASRLIRPGDYLCTFFAFLDHLLELILEQEKLTGKRSGAVCIFDMQNVSLWQWANPFGPMNRAFEARVGVAMAYYAEMLLKVVIINPPRFLSLLFKIMSFLLPLKILGRFHIAPTHLDIQKWISPEAIPIGFGGQKQVPGVTLPEGYDPPEQFGKDQFLKDGAIWEQYTIGKPITYEHHTVKAGGSFVHEMDAKQGQTLLYEWFANRDFSVKLETQNGDFLWPNFRLCTPVLAEEGAITIKEDTQIRLEIINASRILKMKLRIAILLID